MASSTLSSAPSAIPVRGARPEDVPAIHRLIGELARHERLEHQVTGTAADLRSHLFGERPFAEAIVAEAEHEGRAQVVGFALFFHNYSTFLSRPGLYLEDLFVLEAHRRAGLGRALLREVARIAVSRGCGRLEWSVLDWNAPAIAFYASIGAPPMADWRICRLTGDALAQFGAP